MRIAFFENLPPGGALRAAFEIGRELRNRGHELHLFRLTVPVSKGPFDLAPYSSTVTEVPFRPVFGALERRVRALKLAPRSYTLFEPLRRAHRRLARKILAGTYDVVFVHQDALIGCPYVVRWLDRLPTVFYCQEPPRVVSERAIMQQHRRHLARSPLMIGWLRLLEDNLVLGRLAEADFANARHPKVIVVNSIFSRERVWAAYARDSTVCYLGIDADRFTPAPSGSARRPEVLSVGLPVAAKGHDLVVEALGRLPAERRPAMRLVLPRQDGVAYVQRLAKNLGVELNVDVSVDEDRFVECYRNAIATVCAARLEPFGLTPIESMACGTPVVAFREAGYRESVIDGDTGFLVDPNVGGLAAGIERLASDKSLVETMGRRGREEVMQHWTWTRTAGQMEEILTAASGRR